MVPCALSRDTPKWAPSTGAPFVGCPQTLSVTFGSEYPAVRSSRKLRPPTVLGDAGCHRSSAQA
jgi:hypothetical protein